MIWVGIASAATWSVPADGSWDDIVNQLVDGDEVQFTEDQTLCIDAGVDLTLEGQVTLTADGCQTLAVANDGETLRIHGLTLVNPDGRAAGSWSSHLALNGVTVDGAGLDTLQGGAVHAYGGTLVVEESTFTNNIAQDGGAIAAIWVTELTIADTLLQGNVATGHGGGVFTYAIDGPVHLVDLDVLDNAAADGGGLAAHWYHQMTISSSRFQGNTASGYGGALTHWYNADATLVDSDFSDNQAGNSGGAISAYGGTQDDFSLALHDSTLTQNTTRANGGCVDASWLGQVSVSGTTFDSCDAAGSGGGIRTYAIGALELSNSIFVSNTSLNRGGGFESQWTRAESITNSLFVGNTAVIGGGVARYAGYDSVITNNTFVDNGATQYGGAAYLEWSYGTFTNNLLMGSVGTGLYVMEAYTLGNTAFGWNAWDANDVHGGGFAHPAEGDRVGDPGLLGDQDYRLHRLSPLVDAGDPALLDPDGTPSDIGAWGGPNAADEDRDGDGLAYFADCDDSDPDLSEPLDWYRDADGDGYAGEEPVVACFQPEGTVVTWNDCDDTDPDAFPGAVEHRGDGIDQDCDGVDPEPNNPDRSEARNSCSTVPGSGVGVVLAALLAVRRRG